MTYLNDTTYMPGQEIPIPLSTLSGSVLQGFGQVRRSPGGLSNFQFSSQWGRNNQQSLGGMNGNTALMMPMMNFFAPLATEFNVDLPGSGADSPGVNQVTATNTTVNGNTWLTASPSTGDVVLNGSNFQSAVQSLITSTETDSFDQVVADDGGGPLATSPGTSFDLNGDGLASPYIETEGNSTGVEVKFVRNLFERFAGGGTILEPQTQDALLTIDAETDSIVTVSASGSTITIDAEIDSSVIEDAGIVCFKNIAGDSGSNIVADSVTDTLTFENPASSSTPLKGAFEFVTDPSNDKMKLQITPAGHLGFGAQIVRITNADTAGNGDGPATGSDAVGDYRIYRITAYTATASTSGGFDYTSLTNQYLRDYSFNMPTTPLQDQVVDGKVVGLSHVPLPVGTVLLAQRLSNDVWAHGSHPLLAVSC